MEMIDLMGSILSDNGSLDDSNQVIDVPCHTVLQL